MAFSITEFKSKLKYGGARPNQFQVSITIPPGITLSRGNATSGLSNFRSFCKAATIPSDSLNKIDYYIPGGISVPVYGDKPTPESLSLTLTNDEDFSVRDMFEDWSNQIRGHASNVTNLSGDPNEYYGIVEVEQYSKTGVVIKTYRFENAILTNVSSIDLGWETQDTLEEFTVQFDYSHWTARTTDGSGSHT